MTPSKIADLILNGPDITSKISAPFSGYLLIASNVAERVIARYIVGLH